jgi:hypothetical protein
VQPFYRLTGGEGGAGRDTTEEGTAEIRLRQRRGVAGAAWFGRQELTAAWRVRAGWGGIRGAANCQQQARSVAGRAHWGSRLGTACWGRHRRPGGRRPLPLEGREEERERRAGIQIKVSQNFKQKLEKL